MTVADGTIKTVYIDSGLVVRSVIDANTFTVLGDVRKTFSEGWLFMINGKRGVISSAEYTTEAPADDEMRVDGLESTQDEEFNISIPPTQNGSFSGSYAPSERTPDDTPGGENDEISITVYKCENGELADSDIGGSIFIARPVRPEWPNGVVLFDIEKFRAIYPEFALMTDAQLQGAFDRACLVLDNTPRSCVKDVHERETLLFLLVAHLLTISNRGGGSAGALSGASEGSVSASFQPLTGNAQIQWYLQTSYGSDYWQSVKKYIYGGRVYVQHKY